MKTTSTTLLAALSLMVAAPALYAQTPDPDVQPLLDKVAAAYRNVKALSMTIEMTQPNATIKTKLLLKKPTKLAATIERGQIVAHVVSDGTSLYSDTSRDKTTYIKLLLKKPTKLAATIE